jgi:enoyl-CoA hydratase
VLTGADGVSAPADLKELGSGTDYFPWAGSDEGRCARRSANL